MTDERIPDDIAVTLVDPKAYADGTIHESYKWLRANNPLGRAEVEGYDPFWVVTKHADILEISRQNALFHNGDRQTTLTNKAGDAQVRKMTGGSPHLVRSLVQMDTPDHPKYRALTQSASARDIWDDPAYPSAPGCAPDGASRRSSCAPARRPPCWSESSGGRHCETARSAG